jgi:hypothetical protein
MTKQLSIRVGYRLTHPKKERQTDRQTERKKQSKEVIKQGKITTR